MLYAVTLLALWSPDGTAEDLAVQMDASVRVKTPPDRAPPIPLWPEGLPDPILLQPNERLDLDVPATCYPHPTDFALDYHLLHWERYPGKCQRKLNDCWAVLEGFSDDCHQVVDDLKTRLANAETPPALSWKGIMAIVGGVVAAAGLGFAAGYLLGGAK